MGPALCNPFCRKCVSDEPNNPATLDPKIHTVMPGNYWNVQGLETQKPLRGGEVFFNKLKADYFLASVVLVQHSFLQSAPHLVSAFLSVEQVVHSAFFSAFFVEQPQVSHANAELPAINNAIAAILIILFMV
jgi:hypothetical protein